MKLLAFFEAWASFQNEFTERNQPIVVKDLTEEHIVVQTLAHQAGISKATVLEHLQLADITTLNN